MSSSSSIRRQRRDKEKALTTNVEGHPRNKPLVEAILD